jgi:hypothetical protein
MVDFHMADSTNADYLRAQYPGLQDPISEVLMGDQYRRAQKQDLTQGMDANARAYQAQMQQHLEQQAQQWQKNMSANQSQSQKSVVRLAIEVEISISVKQM